MLEHVSQTADPVLVEDRIYQGTRPPEGTGGDGGEGLRAKSSMMIRDCKFLDFGNGAVRANVPTDNLVIEDCYAHHFYRFLEDTSSSSANPAVLTNFALRRIVGTGIDRGMTRIRYDSHNGLIEDVVAFGSTAGEGFELSTPALAGFEPDVCYWEARTSDVLSENGARCGLTATPEAA